MDRRPSRKPKADRCLNRCTTRYGSRREKIVSFFGAPYPTRSAIVQLENGDLWIWSPVKLTAALRAEVDLLGPVRHLVSPNKLHHLYLVGMEGSLP